MYSYTEVSDYGKSATESDVDIIKLLNALNNGNNESVEGAATKVDLLSEVLREHSVKLSAGSETVSSEIVPRITDLVSDFNSNIDRLRTIRSEIVESKRKAEEDERQKALEAMKGFDAKYQTTILPKMDVLLKMNNETLENNGLVSFSVDDDGEDEEQMNLKRQLKNQKLMQRIRRYEFPRTDTRLKLVLFAEQKNPVLETEERRGLLEAEHKALEGALPPVRSHKLGKVEYGDEEIKILNRMINRIYFLRNPRFPVSKKATFSLPGNVTIKSVHNKVGTALTDRSFISSGHSNEAAPPTPRFKAAGTGIIAEPSVVFFSGYTPYHTYTQNLTIRNTTAVAHRFRLSTGPPYKYSQFFDYKLISCPFDNDGMVAPGLSCVYEISFTPNSFADFRQTLLIGTEMGTLFTVGIVAKRQSPELTWPVILDCGPCRAGYITLRTWNFFNKGGAGRFLIMNQGENLDPFQVFDAIGAENHAKPRSVSYGPFEIYPSYFALEENEMGYLQIRYSPHDVPNLNEFDWKVKNVNMIEGRPDNILLRIACDNCQIIELPVVAMAERPDVSITRLERHDGTVLSVKEFQTSDIFNLIYDFNEQNPYGVTSVVIVVRNNSHMKIPIRWAQSDTPFRPNNITLADILDVKAVDSSTCFQITPSKGWLEPNQETAFKVDFCPQTIRPFDVTTELLILGETDSISSHIETTGIFTQLGEERLLRLELVGRGVPYVVYANTHLLHIPKTIYTGESYITCIRLTNSSVSPVAYDTILENITESVADVAISSPVGTIVPDSCISIKVKINGLFPSKVEGTILFRTANGIGPTIRIPLLVNVSLPLRTLAFDANAIDFGLLALGEKKTLQIPLVNYSDMTINYELLAMKRSGEVARPDCYLVHKPSKGIIAPYATQMVELTYIPTWYQRLHGVLECLIHDISTENSTVTLNRDLPPVLASAIDIISMVQTPCIVVKEPRNFVSCFFNVPFKYKISLANDIMLKANFNLIPVKSDAVKIDFEPASGCLEGGDQIDVTVEMMFLSVGNVQNLEFYGIVEGMVENNGLLKFKIDAEVKPLEVSFRIIENEIALNSKAVLQPSSRIKNHHDTPQAHLRFDFGTRCPIFATRSRTLKIRNHSAMVSPFKIWFEKYTPTSQVDSTLSSYQDEVDLKALAIIGRDQSGNQFTIFYMRIIIT